MKKDLSVCLLNDAFPPQIDGVANVVVNYATELNKMKKEVSVVTPEFPNAKDDYDFEVLRYPSINTIDQLGYVTGRPFDVNFISSLVDKDYDILHTHCPMTSNFLARVLSKSLDKPIILTYHTKYDIDIARAIKGKLIQEAAIKAIVANISACDEVWAVSKGAADNLRSLGYKGEIIVMENGVDMPKGKSSLEEIESIRKEYNLKDDRPTFLFVGRMMWYKGIKIILDALKILKDNNKPFEMLFVGSGLEFEEIKDYCHSLNLDKEVIFAGGINDRSKLKQIFSSCDLFLFPSTFDTNGLVVREAASSGLGSVLVKGSCAAEGTKDGVNAILIEENASSLANALMNSDREKYREIGDNAMSDLYRSWSDAVNEAYERYQIVLENYKKNKNKKYDFGDGFMSLISEASVGLDKVKDLNEDIYNKAEYEKNHIKEIVKESISQTKEDLKNLKNK